MNKYFKSTTAKEDDGWQMGFFGNSALDGQDYVLTTNYLKADEVPALMMDSKTGTELVAGLLNCYYNKIDPRSLTKEQILKLGVCTDEDNPAQTTLDLEPNSEIPF